MQEPLRTVASGTVLVVDDNRDLAENLGEVLELAGGRVSVAYDAETAIARLKAERFDLVVSDMRMPGLTGLDLLRYIQQAGLSSFVVVVTAYSQDSLLEEARDAGATDILLKPVDLRRLRDLFHACLGSRPHVD